MNATEREDPLRSRDAPEQARLLAASADDRLAARVLLKNSVLLERQRLVET